MAAGPSAGFDSPGPGGVDVLPSEPGQSAVRRGIYNLGVTTDVPTQDGFDPGNGGEVGLDLVSKGGAIASTANAFGSGLLSDVLLREVPVMYSRARRFDEQRSVALGAFKTATLRNIELTAPYFHDGSHGELKDVMEHYEIPLNNLNTTNRLLNAAADSGASQSDRNGRAGVPRG